MSPTRSLPLFIKQFPFENGDGITFLRHVSSKKIYIIKICFFLFTEKSRDKIKKTCRLYSPPSGIRFRSLLVTVSYREFDVRFREPPSHFGRQKVPTFIRTRQFCFESNHLLCFVQEIQEFNQEFVLRQSDFQKTKTTCQSEYKRCSYLRFLR